MKRPSKQFCWLVSLRNYGEFPISKDGSFRIRHVLAKLPESCFCDNALQVRSQLTSPSTGGMEEGAKYPIFSWGFGREGAFASALFQ